MAKSKSSKSAAQSATRQSMSDGAREMLALVLSGFALYALLCLITFHKAELDQPAPIGEGRNLGGTFGYYLASCFTYLLGYASVFPFLGVLGAAVALFLHRRIERVLLKAIGIWVFTAMIALLLADPHGGPASGSAMVPHGAGGAFGANLSPQMYNVFGGPGRILLLLFGAIVALVVSTEWMFSEALRRVAVALRSMFARMGAGRAALAGGGGLEVDDVEEPVPARRSRASKPKAVAQDDDDGDDEDDEDLDDDSDDDDSPAASKRARASKPRVSIDADLDDEEDEIDEDDEDDEQSSRAAKSNKAKADKKEPSKKGAVEPVAQKQDPVPQAEAPAVEPPKIVVAPRPKIVKPKPKPKPKQADLPYDEAYPFPPIDLFVEAKAVDGGLSEDQLARGGQAIVSKLKSFGIESHIEAASVGPAVTQYELRLAEGIRVKKISDYSDDLAAALKALTVRVVAPIPGKDTVGIEVPNPERQKVLMRELLEQFGRAEDLALPLFLGKDVSGTPIVEDLAKMPHMLIAGTTGSGKSVCINAILLSILMTRTPSQVKLLLVDPKQVELQAYRKVPHLCCDVVTNMKKVPSVLQWAVDEMENRYTLMSQVGVNHIKSYNRLGQQEIEKRVGHAVEADRVQFPYVVIVIDEFADLMNVAQAEVEESIQRLAQKSRAVGMHVILATQRPSREVITGIIKSNLPCQISFKVSRQVDSRVILDQKGAEKLLGHGDMLFNAPSGSLTRAQGAFVSEEELHSVVKFLEEKGQKPTYLPELLQEPTAKRKSPADRDEYYAKAVEIILGNQRGSATLLQRALGVGYTRGTRLLEMMEEDGLVGAFNGSKSREVLMTLEEYQAREAAIQEELARIAEDGEGSATEESSDTEMASSVADGADGAGADSSEANDAAD